MNNYQWFLTVDDPPKDRILAMTPSVNLTIDPKAKDLSEEKKAHVQSARKLRNTCNLGHKAKWRFVKIPRIMSGPVDRWQVICPVCGLLQQLAEKPVIK